MKISPERLARLTQRERETVVFILSGHTSNKEIAARLNTSDSTARNHLKSIFLKLGVHDRSSLILGLCNVPEAISYVKGNSNAKQAAAQGSFTEQEVDDVGQTKASRDQSFPHRP